MVVRSLVVDLGLARQVETVLSDFAGQQECQASLCSIDFYGWNGLVPAHDDMYEPIRFVQETLELSSDELLNLAP